MRLFCKWSIVFSCAMALNFFVVLKATNASTQVETDQLLCPSTLLWAVLEKDVESVEMLLEYGVDPNTSLENCQGLGIEDFNRLDWFPENSLLLHIAAQFYNPGNLYNSIDASEVYNLLVLHGADIDAMDAAGRTPDNILRAQMRFPNRSSFSF